MLKFIWRNFMDKITNIEIEKSLQTKFRKSILTKFIKGIKQYRLIEPNDKIAVCMSGGKDSFLMAKLFQELLRFSDIPFSVEFFGHGPWL